jgi:endo-1,4-beta-xylanase
MIDHPRPRLLGLLLAACTLPVAGQMAATSNGKFVGNILKSTTTPDPVFATYWNQVTPENTGKWENVEATRDVMNWTQLDFMYAFTRARGIPFKQHTFVWGQQTPAWVTTLTQAEQREEVEEWIAAFAARYPATEFIDVVNEPLNAPAEYRAALGGAGTTGWDWVIWSFEKTRQYFPNAKLLLNDYNIINSDSETTQYLTIINLLKDRGLIDGIGEQAHFLETTSITTLQNNLNRLAATGLPIYISELDVNLANDTSQLNRYQTLFPVFWTNPAVRGITFWGYKQGEIWQTNGYLLRTNGTKRPALTWLETYIAANPQSFSASVTSPANGQALSNVAPVSASATVTYGSAPFTVTFQKKLDSESEFTTISSDNTAPYSADLGNLPVEIYQVRVTVTDAASATVTSTANTFNVFPSAGGTWLGTSGNWDDPGIWSDGIIANGADATASFTGVDIAEVQTITLNGSRTIGNIVFTDATPPTHNLTISGADTLTLDLASGAPVINVTQADRRLTISSVVAGNDGLQKAGSGMLHLSGNNTHTGTTTIDAGELRLSGGAYTTTARTYQINSEAVLSFSGANQNPNATTTIIQGNGTLRLLNGASISAGAANRRVNINLGAGSLIDVQAGASFGIGYQGINWANNKATLNLDGTHDFWDDTAIIAAALTGSGTISSTNTGDSNGTRNFTLGVENGSGTFTGTITAAGARQMNLIKTGNGIQTFSGSTTFRGTTTVNGGTLHYAKASSLYAGVTTDWVKTKITVNNGGTIAINVGGANEFATGNVTALLSGLGGTVNNNGLRAGSTIAFDTTNASGGTFTVADAIANTTGTGGGAVGLRKIGTNTLVLSNTNTHTGPTILDQGILAITGSLGATAVSVNGGTLAGNGNFGGNVTIAAGAMHSLAVASTSAGQDTSAITGTLAMAGSTLDLTAASTPSAGVYVLATATTGITGLPLFINYNGIDGAVSVDTASTPKRLLLTVTHNYMSWAASQVPPVTGGANGDSDNDGVKNLVEYALVDGDERGVLSGYTITFTKRGAPYGSDVTYIIETSETLGSDSWTDEVTHGPGLLISNPTISHTFTPNTPVKKFARLKVTGP